MKEQWRDVPGHPGFQASSWGRVRVLPYAQIMPYGGIRTRWVSPTHGLIDDQGRPIVIIKRKTYRVHRLVALAFLGPSRGRPVVLHLDEDPTNNDPRNLAWGTQKQNLNAPGFLTYCRSRTGNQSPTHKAKRSRVLG